MAMTLSSKWACPTCTYNNWPSCSKCILCGSLKPSDDVIPRIPVAKYRQQNPGWSKLGPSGVGASLPAGGKGFEVTPCSTTDPLHGNTAQQIHKGPSKCKTKGKWTCSTCTYVNWPNTGKCTMCGAVRTRMTRNDSPVRNEVDRIPVRSTESILCYASGVGAVGGAVVSGSGSGPCDTPLHSTKKTGRRGGQGVNGDNKKKWKCQRCTYENWPRAIKCTMCSGPKVRTPTPPLGAVEDAAPTTPPPSSPHSLHSRSSGHLHPPTPHLSAPQSTPAPSSHLASTTSPSISRAHFNSNDTCATHSNSNDKQVETGFGSNANEPQSGSNMHPVKDTQTESGSSSVRDRQISFGADRYNALSRQIHLKSDTNEVK